MKVNYYSFKALTQNQNRLDSKQMSNKKEKILVILASVYGETDMTYGVAIDSDKLSEEHKSKLSNSLPSQRIDIPGCDKQGYMSTKTERVYVLGKEIPEETPPGNFGLFWEVVERNDFPTFSRENSCEIYFALMNE